MKPRNTVFLVIIAHIGLFLIWMCMGGCSVNRGQNAVDEIPPNDVKIPGPGGEEVDVSTTEIVKETTPKETEKPIVREETATAYDEQTETKYVVKSGDTLSKISKEFGVSVKALQDRNDIQDPKMLREGRELYIPKKGGSDTGVEEAVIEKPIDEEAKTPKETVTEVDTKTDSTETGTTKTETSGTGTTTESDKSESTGTTGTTGAEEPQFEEHIVVAGDTIWKLARTYGVTTDEILKANNITDPTKIQVGQKLLIPKK